VLAGTRLEILTPERLECYPAAVIREGWMRRREFIAALGGAAAWPLGASAQQSAMPVVGFLHPASPDGNADRVRAFREGLKETGFVEGDNVAIEYRWADNNLERLPALATDLVHRRVAVITTFGPPSMFAAKADNSHDLSCSRGSGQARPCDEPCPAGWQFDGSDFFPAEVSGKRLALLRELVPSIVRLAVFVDPNVKTSTESTLRDMDTALPTMGLQRQVHYVSKGGEIDAVFEGFMREPPDAVFVAISASLVDRRVQFALQTMLHKLPATYPVREFVEVGGLMSYGASLREAIRLTGVYAGRILKGAKPADLPVVQSDKLELVINQQTAKMLGIVVPPSLLARADEVIE
jgi:putative ABC transport system substrate-binding protein